MPAPTLLDPSPRSCECNHGGGPFNPQPCGEPAQLRVIVACGDDLCDNHCDDPACAYDLCHDCADHWLEEAAHDPTAPELRLRPL